MKTASLVDEKSIGEGTLSLMLEFTNENMFLKLHKVQLVPNIIENITSCHKFNVQLPTLFVLDNNSGFLYSRYLNKRISMLQVMKDLCSEQQVQRTAITN